MRQRCLKHPGGAIEIGCGRMVDLSSTSKTNGSTRPRSIADLPHRHDLRAGPLWIAPYFSRFAEASGSARPTDGRLPVLWVTLAKSSVSDQIDPNGTAGRPKISNACKQSAFAPCSE